MRLLAAYYTGFFTRSGLGSVPEADRRQGVVDLVSPSPKANSALPAFTS